LIPTFFYQKWFIYQKLFAVFHYFQNSSRNSTIYSYLYCTNYKSLKGFKKVKILLKSQGLKAKQNKKLFVRKG